MDSIVKEIFKYLDKNDYVKTKLLITFIHYKFQEQERQVVKYAARHALMLYA